MAQHIPLDIASDEVLVRGIVHPFFYSNSKGKVKHEAFLPPVNKRDVSVLRLAYTNVHFCKKHCREIKIGDSGYVGMAALRALSVKQASSLSQIGNIVSVEATPLNENNELISVPSPTTDDAGLPMHADILYKDPTERGKPNPIAQQVARYLLKNSIYYPDPEPIVDGWKGSDLAPPAVAA